MFSIALVSVFGQFKKTLVLILSACYVITWALLPWQQFGGVTTTAMLCKWGKYKN